MQVKSPVRPPKPPSSVDDDPSLKRKNSFKPRSIPFSFLNEEDEIYKKFSSATQRKDGNNELNEEPKSNADLFTAM